MIRDFLEGHGGGWLGSLLRTLLLPLAVLYGIIQWLRVLAYQKGFFHTFRASVPVISMGNITLGGTGKTPCTIALSRMILQLGLRPAILTRGYGASDPTQADEVLLFQHLLPQVPVYARADRTLSAQEAMAGGVDVLLLDDGFQHLRLHRDLDIVLLDATAPLGGGWPIPAGALREFPSALQRAHLFILTRWDEVPQEELATFQRWLSYHCPGRPIVLARHSPTRLTCWERGEGGYQPRLLPSFAWLQRQSVIAVAGIARPASFVKTLERLGAEIQGTRFFPDHYSFRPKEMEEIGRLSAQYSAKIVVTEKDAVKLRRLSSSALDSFYSVGIDLLFEDESPIREALVSPFSAAASVCRLTAERRERR